MKIYMAPYKSDLIDIHSLEISYELWRDGKDNTRIDDFVYKVLDYFDQLFRPINHWYRKFDRKIKIRIDNYDVWSMDHTLALIIVPMLKKLKENKMGSPFVDPIDVPENLRPTEEAGPDNGYVDNTHHERWEYVLDEMIWAFEQHADEDDTITKFSGYDENGKYYFDKEGMDKQNERMLNGRILFAKYYSGLWD